MTARKKWLIVAAVVAALGLLAIGAVVIVWNVLNYVPPEHLLLPKYSLEQTDSTHPWYRRTTVHFQSAVYVNDFEDYSILLAYPEPTNAIGRAPFGNSLVCSIPGQNPADYIAVDCGSEMSAYEVFRNVNRPPFDWRKAKFQAMEFAGTMVHAEHKRTTDPALIAEVVRTLRDGTPVTLSLPASVNTTNLATVHLFSDALPGLKFCPQVYRDETGSVYLAESIGVEYGNRTQKIHANWIPASESFANWVQTP
ncbi:MAG TPA: hypothetical protein VLZ12_15555 [Verrucomicrobiae bacterium]|nr:hypothetical protein [Verrucomicrobiae bacterium]